MKKAILLAMCLVLFRAGPAMATTYLNNTTVTGGPDTSRLYITQSYIGDIQIIGTSSGTGTILLAC